MARMTVAALNSKITADLATGEIADQAASDEADRASNDGPGHGSNGRARCSVVCAGARGGHDHCDGRDGKTKRSHVPPCWLLPRNLSKGLRRICDGSAQAE
jgi:hypothetical protein